MPHTFGTIYFARRAKMEVHTKLKFTLLEYYQNDIYIYLSVHFLWDLQFKKTGKRPKRGKLYMDWHKHKNGQPVTNEAAEAIVIQFFSVFEFLLLFLIFGFSFINIRISLFFCVLILCRVKFKKF